MPAFDYSRSHDAFIKECACCKTITIGVASQEESIKIFSEVFARASRASGNSDGFKAYCNYCGGENRRRLGVTRPILEQMFLDQNGKCRICLKDISIQHRAATSIQANVDHNHDTGKIRALLCAKCNLGIGHFYHRVDFLKAAMDYLNEHEPAVVVPLRRI